MNVPRIEWECPGCLRKFAIPDQQPRPKLCPQCTKAAPVQKKRSVPPPPRFPAPTRQTPLSDPEMEFDDYEVDPEPVAMQAPRGSSSHRPVKRQRYEELRTISLWFAIIAVLIALLTLFVSVDLFIDAMKLPAGEMRQQSIIISIGGFMGGITYAMLVYAFSALLMIVKDIEFNTRND